MNENFEAAASGVIPSKGTIYSDCDCTIFNLKDGTSVYKEYLVFLAAMKKSGYDVVIHSASPNDNEGRVRIYSKIVTGEPDFFENDGYIVTPKDETLGKKGLIAFDDDHGSHGIKTTVLADTNDDHVKAVIQRIAQEYESSGRQATFVLNPQLFLKGSAPAPSMDGI